MRNYSVVRAAALVLAASAFWMPGPSRAPRPALDSRFGVVAFDLNEPARSAFAALGAGLVRGSCDWPDLEPSRGVYNWSCSDNVIVTARDLGARSYMTVGCTPAWANHGAGCAEMPSDVSDWYFLVANFVARYSGFDTIFGVWNEPNLTLRDPSGANYALLFINASNARAVVNPRFAIAGPETSDHALASGYFERTFDAIQSFRALAPQDVVAVHWYPGGPPIYDYLDGIHAIAGDRPVWLSETGTAAADAAQAAYYSTIVHQFAESGRGWWTHVVFYRLWDGAACCTEAIVRKDFSVRPAYELLQDWITRLPPPTEQPGESVVQKNGGRVWR